MRAVVQRVTRATVWVGDEVVGRIGPGLVVLLGVGKDDRERDAQQLATKIAGLRIFDDGEGRMNHSVLDVAGDVLVVSQFTLLGDCRRGRRPSYDRAASARDAERLYRQFIDVLGAGGVRVAEGRFQANMDVELVNHGPVTLLVDTAAF